MGVVLPWIPRNIKEKKRFGYEQKTIGQGLDRPLNVFGGGMFIPDIPDIPQKIILE